MEVAQSRKRRFFLMYPVDRIEPDSPEAERSLNELVVLLLRAGLTLPLVTFASQVPK